MSTITLNLPDALVAKLKERDDLDQFATIMFTRELKEERLSGSWSWSDVSAEDQDAIEEGLQEIRNGEEGLTIDQVKSLLKANREQRKATVA
jgi:predicted transcriptional regulator